MPFGALLLFAVLNVTDCFKIRNLVIIFFPFLSLFSIDGVANDDPIGNSARTAACSASRGCLGHEERS
jgi:hypothetical protein